MYLLEKDNYELDQGLLLFIHDEAVLEYYKTNDKKEFVKDSFLKSGKYVTPTVPITGDLAVDYFWVH